MRKGQKGIVALAGSLLMAGLMVNWPMDIPKQVDVAVVREGELIQTVVMSGVTAYCDEQPIVSPRAGVVAKVYAVEGQAFQKGDLLFALDTTAEERALAALHEKRYVLKTAIGNAEGTVAAFAAQNELEWQNQEMQLLTAIEASKIRAAADGVMQAIHVREGDYAAEMAPLGLAHAQGMRIVCPAYARDAAALSTDAAALVSLDDQLLPARLTGSSPMDENGAQNVYFELMDPEASAVLQAGKSVWVEVTQKTDAANALLPLAAIDADEKVWVVQNGRVRSKEVAIDGYSRTHAAVGEEWLNETVVLYPDACCLRDGEAVQVK